MVKSHDATFSHNNVGEHKVALKEIDFVEPHLLLFSRHHCTEKRKLYGRSIYFQRIVNFNFNWQVRYRAYNFIFFCATLPGALSLILYY